jgi:cytochrome P450
MSTVEIDDPLDYSSDEFISNPWPVYKHLRNTAPVYWSERNNAFFVSKYDDVRLALSDSRIVSTFPLRVSRKLFGRTVLDSDGAEHREFRRMLAPIFGRAALPGLRNEVLAPAVDDALAEISTDEDAAGNVAIDFLDRVAVAVPYGVVTRLTGLPSEDAAWLRVRVLLLTQAHEFPPGPLDVARAAKKEIIGYLEGVLADRQDNGWPTLLDLLCPPGEAVNPSRMSLLVMLLGAATETSVSALAKVLHTVVAHGIGFDALLDDTFRERVVLETLRWEPPSHSVVKYAACDLTIRGVRIPRRSAIVLSLASANRDEDAYADPDTWRPARPERRIMSFSTGPHTCIGMQLALDEFDILFRRLSIQYETAELANAPAGVRPGLYRIRERGLTFRKPESLEVRLKRRSEPAATAHDDLVQR